MSDFFAELKASAAETLLAIPIPEWGKPGEKLRFRKYDGESLLACEEIVKRAKNDEPAQWRDKKEGVPQEILDRRLKARRMYYAAIVAACAVTIDPETNEEKPAFVGAGPRAWLESRDLSLLIELRDKIMAYSGLTKEPEAEAEIAEAASADPTASGASASTTKKSGRGKTSSAGSSPGA